MQKDLIELLDSVLTDEVIAQLAEGYIDMNELRSFLVHRIYDFNVKHQCRAPLLQTGYAFGLSPKQIRRVLSNR